MMRVTSETAEATEAVKFAVLACRKNPQQLQSITAAIVLPAENTPVALFRIVPGKSGIYSIG
jgi:hypothetical protein